MERIEDLRARYEDALMRIAGVVAVGTDVDEGGSPRLRVLTSVPVEEVRARLPEEIRQETAVVHVGEIEAQ